MGVENFRKFLINFENIIKTKLLGPGIAIPIVTDYYSQEYEYEACDTELKAARSQPDARNGTVQDDPVHVRLQTNSPIAAHDTARVLQPHTSTGTGVRVQQKDKDKYSRTTRTTSSTLNEGTSSRHGGSAPPSQPPREPPPEPPPPPPPRLGTPCPSPSLP